MRHLIKSIYSVKGVANLSLFLIVLAALLLLCQACTQPSDIRVAVAANLIQPVTEITNQFTQETGLAVSIISGPSGLLATQIRQGAPFDLFISANPAFAQNLFKEGLTHTAPQSLVIGGLIGWSKKKGNQHLRAAFEALSPGQKVAIANPALAPYGAAAQKWLHTENLEHQLAADLVFGESVGQVNQFIRSQSVEIAITAFSATYKPELRDLGSWIPLAQQADSSLAQTLVVLNETTPGATELAAFLAGDAAKAIFQRYGYQ